MVYELNNKFYLKPLVNKIIEVKIVKTSSGFELKTVGKLIFIKNEDKEKLSEISIKSAYDKQNKKDKEF